MTKNARNGNRNKKQINPKTKDERMTSQIVRYDCYYGSSKQRGGGQAYISQ